MAIICHNHRRSTSQKTTKQRVSQLNYLPIGCDEFYIPPDGGLDLRGFSAAATFVRGVFDKVSYTPYNSTIVTITIT